jgi:hypothetical protein
MSVELQKHPTFDDNPVGALVWSTRLFDAIAPAVEAEPVAFTTQAMLDAMKEPDVICGSIWPKAAKLATIPLYTHPSSSVSAEVTVTDEMVERGARAMDPEAFGRDFPVMAAKHYEVRRSIALKKVRAALLAALNGKE